MPVTFMAGARGARGSRCAGRRDRAKPAPNHAEKKTLRGVVEVFWLVFFAISQLLIEVWEVMMEILQKAPAGIVTDVTAGLVKLQEFMAARRKLWKS